MTRDPAAPAGCQNALSRTKHRDMGRQRPNTHLWAEHTSLCTGVSRGRAAQRGAPYAPGRATRPTHAHTHRKYIDKKLPSLNCKYTRFTLCAGRWATGAPATCQRSPAGLAPGQASSQCPVLAAKGPGGRARWQVHRLPGVETTNIYMSARRRRARLSENFGGARQFVANDYVYLRVLLSPNHCHMHAQAGNSLHTRSNTHTHNHRRPQSVPPSTHPAP